MKKRKCSAGIVTRLTLPTDKRQFFLTIITLLFAFLCCGPAVSAAVQFETSEMYYDPVEKVSYLDVAVRNTSTDPVPLPVRAVIDQISEPGVTVANADGIDLFGRPYFEYYLQTGTLLPGESIPARQWRFFNPQAVTFTYQVLEWSPLTTYTLETIVTMLTGTGYVIQFDLGDENPFSGLYSDFMAGVDLWFGDDFHFISEFQTYIKQLHTTLSAGQSSSVALLCIAEKWDGVDPPLRYLPYVDPGDSSRLTCLHEADPSETDALGITINNGTAMAQVSMQGEVFDTYRLKTVLKASNEEVNRNDPTGQSDTVPGMWNSITSVDIFTELEEGMTTPVAQGGCSDYISWDAATGELLGFDAEGLAACFRQTGLNHYVSGLLGIYKVFRDPDLTGSKFSLDELYNVVADKNKIAIRLGTDLWQLGLADQGQLVQVNGASMFLNSYMLSETGEVDPDGNSICEVVCPDPLCIDGVPVSSPDPLVMDELTLTNLFDQFKPGYGSTLQRFENIPTMEEIKQSVFTDAHHEPSNSTGLKTFNVSGTRVDGDRFNTEADVPILCKINNADVNGDFEYKADGTGSFITCEAATAVSWNSEGQPTDPAGNLDTTTYAGYYALSRHSGETGLDFFYSLLNFSNGKVYQLNGQQFRIRGINSNLAAAGSTYDGVIVDGKTLNSINEEVCTTYQDPSGATITDCWTEVYDYVALSLDDASLFPQGDFSPYFWDIAITSSLSLPVAITSNNTDDATDDRAVCLKSSSVSVDGSDNSKVTAPIAPGPADIVNCLANAETVFYYLYPLWGSGTDRNTFAYRLVRNDGVWMHSDNENFYENVSLQTLEALSGVIMADTPVVLIMGPLMAEAWLRTYEIGNLGHDPAFDPYCDDLDGNGCCNILDQASCWEGRYPGAVYTEPTLAGLPYLPGDPQAEDIESLLATYGGLSGTDLVVALYAHSQANPSGGIDDFPLDWSDLFVCLHSGTLQSVDTWAIANNALNGDAATADPNVGYGCIDPSDPTNIAGPVRMRKIIKQYNVYDVSYPQTALKQVSALTASVGTGVTIPRTSEVFLFNEALALPLFRTALPADAVLRHDGQLRENFIYFDRFVWFGNQHEPVGSLLRALIEGAGEFPGWTPDIADCDGDNDADGADLAIVVNLLGRNDCSSADPCPADFDNDGDVDVNDMTIFAADYGWGG